MQYGDYSLEAIFSDERSNMSYNGGTNKSNMIGTIYNYQYPLHKWDFDITYSCSFLRKELRLGRIDRCSDLKRSDHLKL